MDKRILMLIPLSLFFILSMFYRTSSAVIASELVRDLSLTPRDLGLLSSVFFYAFALVQIPMGIAIDHFGAKRVMLFLSCAGLVGVVSFALADSFLMAMVGRALIGAGMACGLMGTFMLISIWFPPRTFATISSIVLSIGTLGSIGATVPLAFAVDWVGWRRTFLLIALMHLAITLWIFKHLGLWEIKTRPPPRVTAPPKASECSMDYSDSQLPVSDNLSRASRSNEWLYVDPEYPETYTG